MTWGIEEIMDLIMVGGGYVREKDSEDGEKKGNAAAKLSVSAVAVVEEKVETPYGDMPGRSFYLRAGAEVIYTPDEFRLGGKFSIAGVPGMLGTLAALNLGANHGLGDGDTDLFVGGEFGFVNIFSPVVEAWSLDGRVTMDFDDKSVGFMVFLNAGGSAKQAMNHN